MSCQGISRGTFLHRGPAHERTTAAHLSVNTAQLPRTAPDSCHRGQHCQRLAPISAAAAVLVSAAPAQTADEATAAAPDEDWEVGEAGLQGPRDSMEDYTSIIRDGRCGFLVALLFDGHSGSHAADWLNERLYGLFSEAINEEIVGEGAADDACEIDALDGSTGLCCPVGLSDVLSQSFKNADQLLLEELKGLDDEDERLSGSTATVALVRRDKIIVANVGDSRAVLCRNGRAVDLSTEHRVYGSNPVVDAEVERVEAAGGWVADGRVCDVIAVSRAFGDLQFKEEAGRQDMLQTGIEVGQWDQEFVDSVSFRESPIVAAPDVTEMTLRPDDEFLVIASDGLWDVMGSRDVISFARQNFKKKANAQTVAEKLAEVAVRRHTADNVAVIVVDLGGGANGWAGAKPKQKGLLTRMFNK